MMEVGTNSVRITQENLALTIVAKDGFYEGMIHLLHRSLVEHIASLLQPPPSELPSHHPSMLHITNQYFEAHVLIDSVTSNFKVSEEECTRRVMWCLVEADLTIFGRSIGHDECDKRRD